MAGLDGVVAQALEASRAKESVLSQQAREVSRAAGVLLAALRERRAVHLLGEGPLALLADYLSEAFREAEGARVLPARLLAGRGAGPDGYLRAVEAFVAQGDALLVLSNEASTRLERAMVGARGRRAVCVGLFGEQAQSLVARCDAAVVVPSAQPFVIAETLLATGHVLQGLVLQGLGRLGLSAPATIASGSSRPSELAAARASELASGSRHGDLVRGPSPTDVGVIVRDPEPTASTPPKSDEGALLAEAVEAGLAPPTDPRGRARRPATQALRFRCTRCEDVITIEARFAGRRGECPSCGVELVVPTPREGTGRTGRPGSGRAGTGRPRAERRRSPRVTVKDAIVRLGRGTYPDGATYQPPRTLDDLSATGLSFISPAKDFEVGEVMFFAIDFPAFPQQVRFKGELRRVTPVKDGDGFRAGVRFVEYVDDAQHKLRRLLEQANLRDVRRR